MNRSTLRELCTAFLFFLQMEKVHKPGAQLSDGRLKPAFRFISAYSRLAPKLGNYVRFESVDSCGKQRGFGSSYDPLLGGMSRVLQFGVLCSEKHFH